MDLLPIVQELEKCSIAERRTYIRQFLRQHRIDYDVQLYPSGENILVHPSGSKPFVAISSHVDVVPGSPGANDNASAVAVCLGLLHRLHTHPVNQIGVAVFFFDEEESGLKGSKAYVREYSIKNIRALLNLELVGQGNQFALWPLNETATGHLLTTFEQAAAEANVPTRRFDRIVTNTADHVSFQQAGLPDAFTVTCVSDADLDVAYHYYKAQEFDVDTSVLLEILQQAPIFRHYHRPTDLSSHLSEDCLRMITNVVWNALLTFDEQ